MMRWKSLSHVAAAGVACLTAGAGPNAAQAAGTWYPIPVEIWQPAFSADSPRTKANYTPLERARKKWRICASIPHVKDAYWLAVNFGITQEARRLGVAVELFEAGGYGNLKRQISQLETCVKNKPDGVIISAISNNGLNSLVDNITERGIPVIDLVNGMSSKSIAARSAVSFGDMGYLAGRYVLRHFGSKPAPVKIAWFPGPKGAAWVAAGDAGFRRAVQGSNLKIVDTLFGDTGKAAQSKLINQALDRHKEIDLIVGTAVTAEAAVSLLRRKQLSKATKVLAYYYSPGVHRGISRGTIAAAPTDQPAIQGRIAVDQLVRILEKKTVNKHVGPVIRMVDKAGFKKFDATTSLAPVGFRVVFSVQ